MKTKMIKVSEATNTQLDWLVAKCRGILQEWANDAGTGRVLRAPSYCRPTTDRAQAMELVESEGVCLRRGHSGWWFAYQLTVNDEEVFLVLSATLLVAVARCYVASKLGENVEVPDDLT